ncbi:MULTISPECIES: hypothetical protein [unclassified Pseudoalteromonas]|uniref:hypothetical protein n=1 Tax=unclassified Pseudoalteromonas TaxID=194690 RepID=UPI00049106DC|nr:MULTISPECIES: hypothetical protein [unclassified Pseudoalteromonas]
MVVDRLKSCEEALERLINGEPEIIKVDSYSEITFGLIEREAGNVSKGYIKPERNKFKSIVDRLEEHKSSVKRKPTKNVIEQLNEKLQKQKEKDKAQIKELTNKLHIMMADNLKLVERCRELEQENLELSSGKLAHIQNVSNH